METVYIRACTAHDIDVVCDMQERWAEENITYGFSPANRVDLAERLGSYFSVAEISDEIVGFCYGSAHVSEDLAIFPPGEQYLEVDDIYVIPEFRNRDVGSALLKALVHTAQENGVQRFLVYSATKDFQRIVSFYQDHGFRPWCVMMFR